MARDRFVRWGARHSRVKRHLRNPYFQRQTVRKRRSLGGWRGLGIAFGSAVALAAVVIIPFEAWTHPAFAIDDISYTVETVSSERQRLIRDAVEHALDTPFIFSISHRSYFLADKETLQEKISETGIYSNVSVQKKFPHTIIITVAEPPKTFLLQDQHQYAVADQKGIVLDIYTKEAASSTSSSTLRTLPLFFTSSSLFLVTVERTEGSADDSFTKAKNGIPENCATLIVALDSGVRRVGVLPTRYTISADATKVSVMTQQGWKLITDPIVDPMSQLEQLALISRDPRYKDQKALEYIDVRYPGKIYLKTR